MRENHTADAAQLLGAGFPPLSEADVRRIRPLPYSSPANAVPPSFHVPSRTDWGESLLSQVERVEIPLASHLMHEENPEAFNRAVLDFVRRHESG